MVWSERACSGAMKMTKGGNIIRLDIDLFTKWVEDTWDSMISKSFQKCCISNAMDGIENDA